MLILRKKFAKSCLWLHKVKPEDLDACHRMKKKVKMIIKFKNRKQRNEVIFKQKQLKSKGEDLLALQFGRSLFIKDSMCFENQVLFYECGRLKNTGKIFSNWIFNNTLHVKNGWKWINLEDVPQLWSREFTAGCKYWWIDK